MMRLLSLSFLYNKFETVEGSLILAWRLKGKKQAWQLNCAQSRNVSSHKPRICHFVKRLLFGLLLGRFCYSRLDPDRLFPSPCTTLRVSCLLVYSSCRKQCAAPLCTAVLEAKANINNNNGKPKHLKKGNLYWQSCWRKSCRQSCSGWCWGRTWISTAVPFTCCFI